MLRDMAPKPRAGGIDCARASRRGLTLPEALLWRELRKRPSGLKFRRQHPSGPFATLRIPAKLVLGDLPGALRWIEAEAIARLPLHHPAAPGGPPPRAKLGEE